MAVPIENLADCEVRCIIRYLQAHEVLGYLAEEASSRVELFCCTKCTSAYWPADTRLAAWAILWDIFKHPPYSPDLAPSDFFLFPKTKEHLAAKHFANDEDQKDAGWITRRSHVMKRVYTNWCQGTSALMSKVTIWKSRQRCVSQLVYSISVLLLKNILVWRNVLYFMDGLRISNSEFHF